MLAEKEPWYSTYGLFANDTYSQSTYTMQGPKAVISRGAISNYTTFSADARAAYQNAIMCKDVSELWADLVVHANGCDRVYNQKRGSL